MRGVGVGGVGIGAELVVRGRVLVTAALSCPFRSAILSDMDRSQDSVGLGVGLIGVAGVAVGGVVGTVAASWLVGHDPADGSGVGGGQTNLMGTGAGAGVGVEARTGTGA